MLTEHNNVINYEDLISHNNWRLKDLVLNNTFGQSQREKGWNTYITKEGQEIKVSESIDSSKTPYEPIILLVPPKLIGTHEATSPDYIPSDDEDQLGFTGISFDAGWDGSPIAVAAHMKCEGNTIIEDNVYSVLYKTLSKNSGLGLLEGLRYGDLGVLDGHHRRRMACEGSIELKFVPVQIIPYLYNQSVILDTWHNDGNVWKAEQVFECFKEPHKYADAKRTKFGVRGTDGVIRRILDTQPHIRIPLINLI